MYSHEIEKLLKLRNNLVTLKEYLQIVSSPQIDHILYKDDMFYIWTTDNYSFKLQIRRDNNER